MKRAGEYLTAIIDADLFKKARSYSGFFSSWARICQDCGIAAAAGHSRIRELEKGILVVEADHPGWIQILQTKAPWILDAARRHAPELDIRGISLTRNGARSPVSPSGPGVSPDPGTEAGPGTDPVPEAEPKSAPERGAGESRGAWDRIEDRAFKESLKRLEQGIREREKSGPKGPGKTGKNR